MARSSGAEILVDMLEGYGVTHVFYVPQIASKALAMMEERPIRRVVTHSEKAAAYMADGYARAKAAPGVCMAQPIGASNLASGLRDARMAGSPVIAISGGPAPTTRHRHAYQEVEDLCQFDAVTKANFEVSDPSRLADMLRQAFREATTGAPGPVHLRLAGRHGELPLGECEPDSRVEAQFGRVPAFRPMAERHFIREAARVLTESRRPLIVAGGGVHLSGAAKQVVMLAERLQIPVATSPNGKGVIADDHRLSVGVVGTYSRSCANKAMADADLLFFIGTPAGGLVTGNWRLPSEDARIIHLDIEPAEVGRNYPNAIPLLGDARAVLDALLQTIELATATTTSEWLGAVRKWRKDWREETSSQSASDSTPIRPERLCAEIGSVLPHDAIVVSDTGHSAMWTTALLDLNRPQQRYIRCSGSLGWGFPGALGVKCAAPERPVLAFVGDGGMHYHVSELETAARLGLNIIVVINNNSALNQEIPSVERIYGGPGRGRSDELWRFGDVDFAKIAEAMGCKGIRVKQPTDIRDALTYALSLERTVVIDAVTDVRAFAPTAWLPAG